MNGRESGMGNRESLKRAAAITIPDFLHSICVPQGEEATAPSFTIPDSPFPIPVFTSHVGI